MPTAFNPLDRVVFAQHVLLFAAHNLKRLLELAQVSTTFDDTVHNYAERVFHLWLTQSDKYWCDWQFFRAACAGATSSVRQMIAAGADPRTCTGSHAVFDVRAESRSLTQQVPVLYAAVLRRVNAETVQLLLDGGADPDCTVAVIQYMGGRSPTPLWICSERGFTELARLLIAAGANGGYERKHDRQSCLNAAARYNNEGGKNGCAMLLVAAPGVRADYCDCDSFTPLHGAALNNDIELTKALLAREDMKRPGVMNWQTENNSEDEPPFFSNKFTPLMVAAACGHAEICSLLLASAGADIHLRNKFDRTALHIAVAGQMSHSVGQKTDEQKSLEVAKLLLAAGAAVDALDTNKLTPLMEAILRESLPLVQLLLEHGADQNVRSIYNDTAMSLAAIQRGNAAIVAALLATGKARGDYKPLMEEARRKGFTEVSTLLLQHVLKN